jgi:Putative auto-transporter adhesin, head GIN domain
MRAFLIAASATLAFAAPANAASRNFGITSFEKVRVEGPYKVVLTTGVAPFAKASGSASALDRIAIEVRGNTLVVHSNLNSGGGYPNQDIGPVEISVGTHDLTAASMSGAGTLAINKIRGLSFDLSAQGSGAIGVGQVDVDQLNVNVVGTASAVLAGRSAKVTAVVRGISSLDASGLAAKDATIGAEGAATIKANVSDTVTVDGKGPVSVTLAGRPSCTLRLAGSASVSGCK